MQENKILFWVIVGIIAAILAIIFIFLRPKIAAREIKNFNDCAKAGYPILETHPEQCKTPEGQSFTK